MSVVKCPCVCSTKLKPYHQVTWNFSLVIRGGLTEWGVLGVRWMLMESLLVVDMSLGRHAHNSRDLPQFVYK